MFDRIAYMLPIIALHSHFMFPCGKRWTLQLRLFVAACYANIILQMKNKYRRLWELDAWGSTPQWLMWRWYQSSLFALHKMCFGIHMMMDLCIKYSIFWSILSITLFISITMFCETESIPWNILFRIQSECGKYLGTCIPRNIINPT